MDELENASTELAAMGGRLPPVLNELGHYKDNHRFLLILSCSFAELLVGTPIEDRCKRGKSINRNSRDFPFSVRLTLLHEMGLLHDLHLQWFEWLRKQRNDALIMQSFVSQQTVYLNGVVKHTARLTSCSVHVRTCFASSGINTFIFSAKNFRWMRDPKRQNN